MKKHSATINKKINKMSIERIIKKLDELKNARQLIVDSNGKEKIIDCRQDNSKYAQALRNRLNVLAT